MAYSLLRHGPVWLAFDGQDADAGTEQILARLQAVVRFIDDILLRLAEAGVGHSVDEVLGLYGRLQTALEAIPRADIERALQQVDAVAGGFARFQRTLDELQRLKGLLDA